MNRLHFPYRPAECDKHRPRSEFRGPVETTSDCERDVPAHVGRPDRCPICTGESIDPVAIVYGYPVFDCLDCSAGFVWPVPDEELLARYYATFWDDYLGESTFVYDRAELRNKIYMREAQFVARIMPDRSARILDVGAGDGAFLRCMKDIGYKAAVGLDRDQASCTRAAEGLDVKIECGDFLRYETGGWDCICLWATIEHLRDPLVYVHRAMELLRPGGIFVVMTGDNAALPARIAGLFDMWVYPPEHLYFFTRKSLKAAYERAGFRDFRCQVGFQGRIKESVLAAQRLWTVLRGQVLRGDQRGFRADASNLLTCTGRRP